MSKHIPNEYFKSYRTSCGTINALDYNPDYRKFLKKFDFRVKGKQIMDAIMLSIYYRDNELLKKFKNIVDSSYTINSVKNKLNKNKKQIGSGPNEDRIEALRLLDKAVDEMNTGNEYNARLNYEGAIKLVGNLELADALVDRGIEKMRNMKLLSANIDFESALELDPNYTLAQEYIDTIKIKKMKANKRLAFLHQISEQLPEDVSRKVTEFLGGKIIKFEILIIKRMIKLNKYGFVKLLKRNTYSDDI